MVDNIENNKDAFSDSSANKAESQPNIKRYETDVTGVSMNNLEVGLWLARNRGIFKKALIFILGAFAFSTAAYGLFGVVFYLVKGSRDDDKMITEMASIKTVSFDFLQQRSAKNISLSSLAVIDNKGTYDFYIEVKNPNTKHWGVISYCFESGGKELECGEDFVLPSEKKYITALGVKAESRPGNVKFSIKELSWRRLDPHKIFNWEEYKSERLKVKIENITFKAGAASELTEKINVNQLSFSITNQSAYGFWDAPILIILYRNNTISGMSKYLLKEFDSYDQKQIEIALVGDYSGVNKIDIVPYINILDNGNYLKPGR